MAADEPSELRHLDGVGLELPVSFRDVTTYQWFDPESDARLVSATGLAAATAELETVVAQRRAQFLRTLAATAKADPVRTLSDTRFPNRWCVGEATLLKPAALHLGALAVGPEIIRFDYISPARDERAFAHLLRSFDAETRPRTAAPGFTLARYGRYLFELPSGLVPPTSFAFEGPGVRLTFTRREVTRPTLADFAAELGCVVAETLAVIDEPIRDVRSEPWLIVQRQYRVRSTLEKAAPEHVFRLAHLSHHDDCVFSLLIHAEPGYGNLEGLTQSVLQSVRLESPP